MVTVLHICFMLLVGNQSVGCYAFRISIVVFVAKNVLLRNCTM